MADFPGTITELGDKIANLKLTEAVLLKDSPAVLERLARANLLAAQLGSPRVIPPDEIARLAAPMVGTDVRWAYYSSLLEDDAPLAGW